MPGGWKGNQSPVTGLGPEYTIWKNDITTGIIHKRVVETQIITNYKVIQNQTSVSLNDLDDIIVMNSHRESQSQRAGYYARGFGTSYGTGRGKTVGDVVFMYVGRPVIIFHQIADPSGVCRLAKTARKSLVTAIKQAEKAEAKLKKEKEMETQNIVRIQAKQNRSSILSTTTSADTELANSVQFTCSKCGNSNPINSNFCVKCGTKFSATCSKCGRTNPTGSAFCNQCGFALA